MAWTLSKEAVEAACKAWCEPLTWPDDYDPEIQRVVRKFMSNVLFAAYPVIRAEVVKELEAWAAEMTNKHGDPNGSAYQNRP